MRWLLTGDLFDAQEALRIGLVQEVVGPERLLARATELAHTIARQSPLGVRATLASTRAMERDGEDAAAKRLLPDIVPLLASDDAREGVQSFLERREARFTGR
jgi:enoyl-CoA hydratase/carnithine racemase